MTIAHKDVIRETRDDARHEIKIRNTGFNH